MVINKRARRKAKQLFRLCLVDDLFDESRAREVARQVAAEGRRDGPAVLTHFLRLVSLDRSRHTVMVESAVPLANDLRTAIEAGMTRRYGLGLTTTFVDRPELIGGMRIRVGNDVYDGSVMAGLMALENSF